MTEENHCQVERVRQALEELLERLAKAVIDNLAQTKRVSCPTRRGSAKRPKGRPKSSE
jgi:hypothetical protein